MWWCNGKGEKLGYERSGFEVGSRFDPGLRFSFFLSKNWKNIFPGVFMNGKHPFVSIHLSGISHAAIIS